MSWVFSWDTTSITLPIAPEQVSDKREAITEVKKMPGQLAVVISIGQAQRVLTIRGYLFEQGRTLEQLVSLYLSPLLGRVGKQVTLNAPGARYDDTYILRSLTYEERKGMMNSLFYTIELIKGSAHYVF